MTNCHEITLESLTGCHAAHKLLPMKNPTAMNFQLADTVASGDWLPLIPAGPVVGRDGRAWSNSNPDYIVSAFDIPLPVDYNHATETGIGDASAAGFITALENRNGEVWGRVEWNDSGSEAIGGKKWKFYSPAFDVSDDGIILRLSSVGLTNKPNLAVPALNSEEKKPMKKLLDALGIADDSGEDAAIAAVEELKTQLNAARPDLARFVPADVHQAALNRAQAAEAELKAIKAAEFSAKVETALNSVPPAQRDNLRAMCKTDADLPFLAKIAEGFAAFTTEAVTNSTASEQDLSEFGGSKELYEAHQRGVKSGAFKE